MYSVKPVVVLYIVRIFISYHVRLLPVLISFLSPQNMTIVLTANTIKNVNTSSRGENKEK